MGGGEKKGKKKEKKKEKRSGTWVVGEKKKRKREGIYNGTKGDEEGK